MKWPWRKRDDELDEEIRAHIEMSARERVERGATADEARAAARREFGNVGLVKETTRDVWGFVWLGQLLRDARHAIRTLRKKRRFIASVVLSLGFGIGLNTAVFSFVNTVLLRPFPYKDPARLVLIWGTTSFDVRRGMDGQLVDRWRAGSRTIEDAAVFQLNSFPFVFGSDASDSVRGGMVGTRLFPLLGAAPLLGRTFSEFADEVGGKSVVLSYGLWKSRFAGDASVIGKTIVLNNETYTIVGVMRAGFFFPDQDAQLWVPLTRSDPMFTQVHALARLRPGVTPRQAQAELDALNEDASSTEAALHPGVFPLYAVVFGKYTTALWTLLGAVALLLLLACANVSSLFLARNVEREREFAVRASLGANRASLFRLSLVENTIACAPAGAVGILVAFWGVRLLAGMRLASMPRFESARVDGWALLFAVGASMLTGVLSGLAPAWTGSRPNLVEALQSGGAATETRSHGRIRDLLVTVEVALALVLMASAGLMINSFIRLVRADWGFGAGNVLVVSYSFQSKMAVAREAQAVDEITSSLTGVPGVQSSSAGQGVPVDYGYRFAQISIDGKWVNRDWTVASVVVSPGYFRTLGVPMFRGRDFDSRDGEDSPRSVVVGKKLAEKLWPGQDPIGRQFELLKLRDDLRDRARKDPTSLDNATVNSPASWEPDGRSWQVIGEVADVRWFGIDYDPYPTVYIDTHQEQSWHQPTVGRFLVRTTVEPPKIARDVEARILAEGVPVRIISITTMSDLVSQSIAGRGSDKLLLVVSSLFGGVSLVLAATGIYGVVSSRSAQRTREIGIRKTLGAGSQDVLRLVLSQGMRPVLFGVALGLTASFAATRLLNGLLIGVRPWDPETFAIVTIALLLAALAACWIPARRATRVDPMVALRYE
jgi:putative ABC transport system permease protein